MGITLEELYKDRCRGPQGNYPGTRAMYRHLPRLRQLVLDTGAKQVVELGVNTGQSSVAFLLGLQQTGGRLWSCDIKPPLPPIDQFVGKLDNWLVVLGDSRNALGLAPERIDILLVDAALENRATDLSLYGPRVRLGGYILVHDTERPAVAQAVEGFVNYAGYSCISVQAGHGMAIIKAEKR